MDTDQIIAQFLNLLPDKWAVFAPFALLMLSGICNILAVGLKPPEAGSPHYALRKILYLVVTWGALNLGRASNRLQCERTGLMVRREDADTATHILKTAGIGVLLRKESLNVPYEKQEERNDK